MGDLKTRAAAPIATETSLDAMSQRQLLRFMLLTRRLEERLVNLYRQGKVVGGLYRSLGQEATSVGSAFALGPDDYLGPLIRNLGSMLTRGVRPVEMFKQYMARADSPTGGKDANNHMGDVAGRGHVLRQRHDESRLAHGRAPAQDDELLFPQPAQFGVEIGESG